MAEAQNEGYFCIIPIFKHDSNFISQTWSHKLLTITIATGMPKNLYAMIFKWFWPVLPGQKQLSLCIFKEQMPSK